MASSSSSNFSFVEYDAAAVVLELFQELEGAAPIAVGGLLAAEEALEGVAGFGVLLEGGADGVFGIGVSGGAQGDDFGFDAVVAVAHPMGADDVFEESGFHGSDGLEVLRGIRR